MKKKIDYKINEILDIEELMGLFYGSGYLPIENMDDLPRIEKMFREANLVVSAWEGQKLIGVSRSLCDYSYACYLSDICVDKSYRSLGIGKRLIEITKEKAGKECKLILQSSSNAVAFYEKIGMTRISDAFIIQREY